MNKFMFCLISIFFIFLSACQDLGDSKPENRRKGSKVLLNYAKTPIDKAKGVNKITDDRNKKMEDSLTAFEE